MPYDAFLADRILQNLKEKHTMMAIQLKEKPEMFSLYSSEAYIDLVTDFIAL